MKVRHTFALDEHAGSKVVVAGFKALNDHLRSEQTQFSGHAARALEGIRHNPAHWGRGQRVSPYGRISGNEPYAPLS